MTLKRITLPKIHLPTKYYHNTCNARKDNILVYNKTISRHVFFNQRNKVVGQYHPFTNTIGLFKYGLRQLANDNNVSIEEQVSHTLSHEILHAVLLKEHGYDACIGLDLKFKKSKSLARHLKEYGVW